MIKICFSNYYTQIGAALLFFMLTIDCLHPGGTIGERVRLGYRRWKRFRDGSAVLVQELMWLNKRGEKYNYQDNNRVLSLWVSNASRRIAIFL